MSSFRPYIATAYPIIGISREPRAVTGMRGLGDGGMNGPLVYGLRRGREEVLHKGDFECVPDHRSTKGCRDGMGL